MKWQDLMVSYDLPEFSFDIHWLARIHTMMVSRSLLS
jgi:hypothetical protein